MDNQKLQLYIEELIPKRTELLTEIEQYAQENEIPIMEIVGIEALLQLLRIQNPQTILEVGTAIGYSSLRMAYALPDAKIITIERDESRLQKAVEYIGKAAKQEQIIIINGDALEVEEQIKPHGPFDVIFIDAAKGQYQRFFDLYSQYLADGGLIITDNVLFKGLVAEAMIDSRSLRALVRKIRNYNSWLMEHPDYHTVIIPVGDGIAISKKRGEQG
ncbi:O-methyltransferase [Bacillus marasmi]|uniref:O-methyltransferase n=1 Tax=Bacillus marasmi TaxID=1926279 RepID=UPI0011CCBE01|nr:O-methyltransferase [Bacillus marasmi]